MKTNQLDNLRGRDNVDKKDGGETIFYHSTSAPQIATQTLSDDFALALLNLQGSNEISLLEMIKFDKDRSEYAIFFAYIRTNR